MVLTIQIWKSRKGKFYPWRRKKASKGILKRINNTIEEAQIRL